LPSCADAATASPLGVMPRRIVVDASTERAPDSAAFLEYVGVNSFANFDLNQHASFGGKLDGIADEIDKDLAQTATVTR